MNPMMAMRSIMLQQQAVLYQQLMNIRYELYSRNAYQQTVMNQMAFTGTQMYGSMTGVDVLSSAIQQAAGGIVEKFQIMETFYRKAVRARRGTFRNMYEQAGLEAGQSAQAKWDKVKRKGSKSYRSGAPGSLKRYSGGVLREAIASPENWLATPDGIMFINTAYLSAVAPQWYRLEFGAGKRGAAAPVIHHTHEWRLFGERSGMKFNLATSHPPSATWKIPPGAFYIGKDFVPRGARMGHRFVPMYETEQSPEFKHVRKQSGSPEEAQRNKNSVGIYIKGTRKKNTIPRISWTVSQGTEPRGFLDAGVKRLVQAVDVGGTIIIREIMRDSVRGGGATGPPGKAAVNYADQVVVLKQAETYASQLAASHITKNLVANYESLFAQAMFRFGG